MRGTQLLFEDEIHLIGELATVAFHVHLEVEPEAARIPVGRAEKDPVAVHYHQLGMVEGRGREPDVTAAFQHLPPERARRPVHGRQIVFGGQDDVHAHAAERGKVQRGDERGVGQEIRRENLHRGLRLGQRGKQGPAELVIVGIRPVGDDAGDDVAGFLEVGKPKVAVENFAGGERPVVGEGFLQVHDDRTFHAEVEILNRIFGKLGGARLRRAQIF